MGAGVSEENDVAEAQVSGMPDATGLAVDLAIEEARAVQLDLTPSEKSELAWMHS